MDHGVVSGSNTPTLNARSGFITTAALATAASGSQAITLANNLADVGDVVQAMCDPLTSAGVPCVANAKVTAGQIVFTIQNLSTTTALNAAVGIYFEIIDKKSLIIP